MTRRVLVTGAGGFIGSHFVAHLLVNTDWQIVTIDSWRHKGVSERLSLSEHYQKNKDRVEVFTHDLGAPISNVLIDKLGKIDYIINFASESHVDRSIDDPVPFVENNVKLMLNILEYARKIKPWKFIQISTDEVYGPTGEEDTHPEWDPILPSNPYSASKCAQEAIGISYWRTYGVPFVIVNVMNTFAETQDKEKFIPLIMKKILKGEKVSIHYDAKTGKPGTRYWLHARNTADAVLFLLNKLDSNAILYPKISKPERFNIVGERRISNLEIAEKIAEIMGKKLDYELVDFHSGRPGHDPNYGLDGTRLANLGYKFPVNLDKSLKKTVEWTMKHPEWLL